MRQARKQTDHPPYMPLGGLHLYEVPVGDDRVPRTMDGLKGRIGSEALIEAR